MHMGNRIEKLLIKIACLIALAAMLIPAVACAEDAGNPYCMAPPFISGGIKPNLLMLIDNSSSMYDMGYIAGSNGTVPTYSCGSNLVSSAYCFDNTYDDTKEYEGYFSTFDPIANSSNYPFYQYSGGKFSVVAGLPATAADNVNIFKTSYVYVGLSGDASATPSTRTVSTFVASGKFLNWLSASKFDIEKKILTGGKFDPTTSTLTGESRGCVGRRFVKVLPAIPKLSFAVRGPTSVEPNFDPRTQGGQSAIEIFEGTYNATACQCAVYNWSNGSYGQASTDTKSCLGTTPSDNALATLNHTQQTCYVLKAKFADPTTSYDSDGWPTTGLNFNDVKVACNNVYMDSKNPIAPAALTDESNGNYICTSAAVHGIPTGRYIGPGSDTTGFVGKCWNGSADKFGSGAGSDSCIKREILHYCMGTNFAEVTDPTSIIPTTGNIPAVIMDAGVRAIGAPVGVFDAKVAVTSAPSGLVQQFSEDIRFGAMKFNDFGSTTECGSTALPCPASGVTNKDASMMMTNSYIGSSIGDHSSGIVKDIDDVVAKTWTPFAEGYYNAIAYFVKDATATTPTLSSTKFTARTTAPASIAAPVNSTDFDANRNPIQFRCQQNNILIITDGSSTADQNATVKGKVLEGGTDGVFRDPSTTAEATTCGSYSGSPFLHDLSYFAKHRNIFNPSQVCDPVGTDLCEAAQTIKTHVVFNAPPSSNTTDVCDSYNQMRLTALNGGTTVNSAADPADLRTALKTALEKVAAGASSGTAASILSNSEGSGANILQAVFFPKKVFESQTSVDWIGEIQNLWYFVDPQISHSTIREDTPPGDLLKLNLQHDKVVSFRFSTADNTTYGYLSQDTDGDGIADTAETKVDADDVNSLWRAGKILHARNVLSDPRNLYTPLISGGTELGSTGLMRFSYGEGDPVRPDHSTLLTPYLQASSAANARDIMKYVQGFDNATMRSRTVKKWGIPAGTVGSSTYLDDARLRGLGVWKLGDIISSTPRIQSVSKLNNYNLPAPGGYSDSSYSSYIGSNEYKGRGMVYVGANDGMMHAFKLGVLRVNASGFEKASIDPDPDLGKEMWAYIPKNVLPYLNYYPASNYHHLYYVDGASLLFDASIGTRTAASGGCTAANYWECTKLSSVVDSSNNLNSGNTWRSILIGGMGLGGASTKTCASGSNCVQTPITDPANVSLGFGYSSYFALDVTTPASPKLLWEFNHADLGFATSGPAIIRVGPSNTNGHWYAVFGSGPTGPVDTANNQFMGRSNQTLKFFIVDLLTGNLEHTIDTGITDAFAGSMIGSAIDADRWNQGITGNYQDDAIYVGYTKKVSGTPDTWTNGGVIRIMTKESSTPSTWGWSSVIENTGPVVTAISRLQDRKNKNLWLYFGTGRYFYRYGSTVDDFSSRRAIYGIKEPCYNTNARPGNYLDKDCSATITSGVTNQSDSVTAVGAGGWKIDLANSTTANGAERVVTDAVALTNGTVFFTSFAPTADACGFGGNSYLWGLDYGTGGRPDDAALVGKALIQLSTGEFKEVDLAEAFGAGSARLGRVTGIPMTGKPPADAFPIVTKSGNKPVKRIMHIQER